MNPNTSLDYKWAAIDEPFLDGGIEVTNADNEEYVFATLFVRAADCRPNKMAFSHF